jgi:hypothetical protein
VKKRITADEFIKLAADRADDYEEQPDGTYLLQIIGADGQLEQPEDVSGLKSAYEKSKEELARLKEQQREERAARASGDDGSLLELRQKQLADSEARIAQIAINGQAALDAMDAKCAPLVAEADAKLKASRAGYDKIFLDHGLYSVIRDAGGAPELLQGKLEKCCRVEHDAETDEARIVVVDDNGVRRDDPVTGQPISAAHALEEFRLFDPRLQAAFKNGNGNNGGAPTQG